MIADEKMFDENDGKQVNEFVFPYVYGSLAFSMGKKGDSYTHKWICYVRGHNNEDLSYLISKVVFTLHSSFTNPVRCNDVFTQKSFALPMKSNKQDGDSFKSS